jgi:toxin ParE1/3/4
MKRSSIRGQAFLHAMSSNGCASITPTRSAGNEKAFRLYQYIAAEAGTEIAASYIDRIETACMALETFPEHGMRRDDIRRGLRTMGFERRATIAFQVKKIRSGDRSDFLWRAGL